jgi:hypothetical protein
MKDHIPFDKLQLMDELLLFFFYYSDGLKLGKKKTKQSHS